MQKMAALCDAHHHLWKYSAADYGWITEDMASIRRNFLAEDAHAAFAKSGFTSSIVVQARQSLVETEWLLDTANNNRFIVGVVGWLPLCQAGAIRGYLDRLPSNHSLVGARHVLQAESDDFFLREDFLEGLRVFASYGLAYDLLIYERQLPTALKMLEKVKGLRVVLDHLGKPVAHAMPSSFWKEHIKILAENTSFVCKFSGLCTESPRRKWSYDSLMPYFEVVWEAFGPDRVMFGSDWPVCLTVMSHLDWVNLCQSCVEHLSAKDQESFWSGCARKFYLQKVVAP